jgi:hypothetical protein
LLRGLQQGLGLSGTQEVLVGSRWPLTGAEACSRDNSWDGKQEALLTDDRSEAHRAHAHTCLFL